jgi:uncharacterized protein (DUF2062 family)
MSPLPGPWWRHYVYHMTPSGLKARVAFLIRRSRRFIIRRVLHTDDPPHQLALGVAIGIFVALTPTGGFQTALVVFLAWLMGANKVIGIPFVWISNPATLVPIYYPCYLVGRFLLGEPEIKWPWWEELMHPPSGWFAMTHFYWSRMIEIAAPLWLGCIIVSGALAVMTYYLVYFSVRWYRLRRWGQLVPPLRTARRARRISANAASSPSHLPR